ncbi:flagellar biosynthesis protein [Oikeobacillus pervagus]|uniref:Flagellar biosynthesis protein n=1 Tax=Oikeobacillus pervagus TaxID=1325931 RepID=A0AAJ1SZ12_9BACI|nr:EscU/YscU/HrcU family type III secretion system export apparatus switch protein [Oikeobacillus pervagus]MDQ0214317.1 flagellar biosynthesis protein [Oikeobacillus pervagus]
MKYQNKRKQAAALSYHPESPNPPVLVAKGKGKIAENIINQAKEHHIPIQEDPSLVELLGQLEMNKMIPEELYNAVAEVFTFVYRIDQKSGE